MKKNIKVLKFILRKDSVQINIELRNLALKDKLNFIGDLSHFLEEKGTIVRSDEMALSLPLTQPRKVYKVQDIESEDYIECDYCHERSPLGSEICSNCHGSFKLIGSREIRMMPKEEKCQ